MKPWPAGASTAPQCPRRVAKVTATLSAVRSKDVSTDSHRRHSWIWGHAPARPLCWCRNIRKEE